METKPKYLYKNGKRLDGRKLEDYRKVKIKTGVIPNADGSAEVIFGKTKVIAAVHGPRVMHPKRLAKFDRATLRAKYDMFTFSVEDRKRPGPGRRETEISKVLGEALSAVSMLEKFPLTVIDVFIPVTQADASTRIAGLNAASVAMADAGIPMKSLAVGVTFGKIYDEKGKGHVAVDVYKPEDQWGMADVAYARAPSTGDVLLLQMDGDMSKEEFDLGKKWADKAIDAVHKTQIKALKGRYEVKE